MDARHVAVLVLMICGVAFMLLSSAALLVLPGPYQRLHGLAPATSAGLPLIGLALAVDAGPGRTAVKYLVIAALAAVTGPVVGIAIGRTITRTATEGAGSSGAEDEPPA